MVSLEIWSMWDGGDGDPAGCGPAVPCPCPRASEAPLLLPMQQALLERAPQGSRQKWEEKNDHTAKEAEGTSVEIVIREEFSLWTEAPLMVPSSVLLFCCSHGEAGRNKWALLCITSICQRRSDGPLRGGNSLHLHLYPKEEKGRRGRKTREEREIGKSSTEGFISHPTPTTKDPRAFTVFSDWESHLILLLLPFSPLIWLSSFGDINSLHSSSFKKLIA